MPIVESNIAQRYFRLLHRSREQGSPADGLLKLVEMAASALEGRDYDTALAALTGLNVAINTARPLLDATTDRHRDLMEILLLRKQLLELSRANAVMRGDDQDTAQCERLISSLDEVFSASIADLDPDV